MSEQSNIPHSNGESSRASGNRQPGHVPRLSLEAPYERVAQVTARHGALSGTFFYPVPGSVAQRAERVRESLGISAVELGALAMELTALSLRHLVERGDPTNYLRAAWNATVERPQPNWERVRMLYEMGMRESPESDESPA